MKKNNSFNNKKAVITGIYGQDAYFLAKSLVNSGYEVFGTTRKKRSSIINNFLIDKNIFEVDLQNYNEVTNFLNHINPSFIYHLSAQSSVATSFKKINETEKSIINTTKNFLEYLKKNDSKIKFYNACSSECFGETKGFIADETTIFNPISPYGRFKSEAFVLVSEYRESYSLNLKSGILFNHESKIRPKFYVTQKIIDSAYRASQDQLDEIEIGNITISRDWGYAPEYIEAMRLIAESEYNEDYIVATGISCTLEEFIRLSFNFFGLDYKNYIKINPKFYREKEIMESNGNPKKIHQHLGWRAKTDYKKLINKLCKHKQESENNMC